MAYELSAGAIADGCIFCLAVDQDGLTVKEFAGVSATMVVDGNVTIGTKSWKGVTQPYFETFADGDFGFDGVTWAGGDGRLFAIAAPAGITLGVIAAGMSAGANGTFIVSFSEDQLGLRITAGKALMNFGAGGATTTTTIPTDGTSFHISTNYDAFTGGNSQIGYGTEAGSFAYEATASQGEFGGNNRLTGIGGTPGNGNQPGKWHIIYGFDTETSEALKQTIHADPWAYFFAESEPPPPATATDMLARLSGGASNQDMDVGGGAKSSRAVPAGLLNNLFPPITAAQAASGRTDYRCIYLHNSAVGDTPSLSLYISGSPAHATMAIGLGGAVNATAATPANDTTAPMGVTFSAPSVGSPLTIGAVPGGQHQAVWIRRITSAAAAPSRDESLTLTISDGSVTKTVTLTHTVLGDETRVWMALAAAAPMSSVDPCPGGLCNYSGSGKQASIMSAWGSACYGDDYLVVFGGGHGDYGGNEVYKFGPMSTPLTAAWERLTTPSTPTGGSEASGKYGDGLPRSIHSGHSAICFDRFNGALFVPVMASEHTDAGGSTQAFAFDLDTEQWDLTLPAGGPQNPGGGGVGGSNDNRSCYVTGLDRIFFEPFSSRGNWALYNPATKTWADYLGGDDSDSACQFTVYDHRRHRVYGFGDQVDDEIAVWELGVDAPPTKETTTGTPAAAFTSSSSAGYVYDAHRDRVIAWDGGEELVELHPATLAWTPHTIPAQDVTPSAPQVNGTYGRFACIEPSAAHPKGAYLLVNATNQPVYLFTAESNEPAQGDDYITGRPFDPFGWYRP